MIIVMRIWTLTFKELISQIKSKIYINKLQEILIFLLPHNNITTLNYK
jgi:hypothetical protein